MKNKKNNSIMRIRKNPMMGFIIAPGKQHDLVKNHQHQRSRWNPRVTALQSTSVLGVSNMFQMATTPTVSTIMMNGKVSISVNASCVFLSLLSYVAE